MISAGFQSAYVIFFFVFAAVFIVSFLAGVSFGKPVKALINAKSGAAVSKLLNPFYKSITPLYFLHVYSVGYNLQLVKGFLERFHLQGGLLAVSCLSLLVQPAPSGLFTHLPSVVVL